MRKIFFLCLKIVLRFTLLNDRMLWQFIVKLKAQKHDQF